MLQRHGLHDGAGRRPRRGSPCRARADAPGRRPDQDHDVGRRGLALRSTRQPPVQPGRGGRRRRGGPRLRPLRLCPRLHAGGHHAGDARRRAHDRARQPDRRARRAADGGQGRLPGRQPRDLSRDEGARRIVRHDRRHAGQERPRAGAWLPLARDLQASGGAGGLRQRSPGPAPGGAEPRVPDPRRGDEAARGDPVGHDAGRAPAAPGGQARRGRARRPSPISWSSTATRSATSASSRSRASTWPPS